MNRHTKAYLSFVFICFVWGTTYLAIRVGVLHYPAFLFAGIRQVVSGVLIVVIAWLMNRNVDLSLKAIKHHALVGFLMITVGNGLVTWGEQYIPSGISALICGLMPIAAVIINLFISQGKEKLNGLVVAGLLLGICGIALIFRHNIRELANLQYLAGIACTLIATSAWALGSIVNKRNPVKTNPIFNSGLQLAFGGVFLLIGSPFVDSYKGFTLWNSEGVIALAYLIVFGSVLAYTAYMYCLEVLPVGFVTSYAYVNPLVAVILGWLILKEPLNVWTGFAFTTIIGGVFMVNQGYKRQQKETKHQNEISERGVELIEEEFAK